MTDDFGPSAGEVTPKQAATAGARQGGRWRTAIVIGVIVVFLAIVLYVVRNSVSAGDLKVGDCFDIPTQTTIKTVDHHPCTESHTAEVILVADYTGEGSTYPISLRLNSFVEEHCQPAFTTYVGREIDSLPDLSIGYFYPSRDGWENGDRTITCYVARSDEGQMVESVKGSATP
ncbi:MAG TPA: septum formation family protein [Candidatus Eisenbacteria bacterium]|nr:septum formation family protein [Candidatus Eisenbacteria bacterium]